MDLRRTVSLPVAALLGSGLVGCKTLDLAGETAGPIGRDAKVVAAPGDADRECLVRAMYFESNRSDPDGLLAVGTVVMNRLDSPKFPDSICGVVGQKRQFADGVLTKPLRASERERVARVANALLAGERHAEVAAALHFHVVGRTFRYGNMHYLASMGGNRFYEKTDREGRRPAPFPSAVVRTAAGDLVPLKVAFAEPSPDKDIADSPAALAPAEPSPKP